MINILFFSQNDKTAKIVKQALEDSSFNIQILSIFEPLNIKTEKFKLCIIDIAELDITGDSFFSEFIRNYWDCPHGD